MIDTRTREKLEFDMAEAIREHGRAQVNLREATYEVAKLALKNEPIPQDLRDKISEAEWDLEYWPQRLAEVKKEYIQLIKDIEIPAVL